VFAAPATPTATVSTYPPATRTRAHWGGGGQAGIYYRADSRWRFGASIKSPQWFETFEFNSSDELGRDRALTLEIDYPLVASVGTAFDATPDLLLTVDLRYIDYENTRGFGSPAEFEPTGAAAGLGWRGIWAMAVGAQYRWSDRASMRLGYLYNEKPFRESTFFNIASGHLRTPSSLASPRSLSAGSRLSPTCMRSRTPRSASRPRGGPGCLGGSRPAHGSVVAGRTSRSSARRASALSKRWRRHMTDDRTTRVAISAAGAFLTAPRADEPR
jgi:hypothetical protein